MKFFTNKKAMTLTELIIAVMIWSMVLIILFWFITNIISWTQDSSEKNKIVEQWFQSYNEFNKKVQWGFFWTWIIDYDEWVWYDVLLMMNHDHSKWYIWGVVDTNTMKLDNPAEYNIYKNKVFWYRSLSANEISEILANPNKVYEKVFFRDKLYDALFAKDFQVDLYNSGAILDVNFTIWMWYNSNFDWQKITDLVRQDYLMKFNLNF